MSQLPGILCGPFVRRRAHIESSKVSSSEGCLDNIQRWSWTEGISHGSHCLTPSSNFNPEYFVGYVQGMGAPERL